MASPAAADPSGKYNADLWNLRTLIWLAEALVVRLFWWVCSLMSVERASMLGAKLMGFLGPRMRHRTGIIG